MACCCMWYGRPGEGESEFPGKVGETGDGNEAGVDDGIIVGSGSKGRED
jgi:hypothetical protein